MPGREFPRNACQRVARPRAILSQSGDLLRPGIVHRLDKELPHSPGGENDFAHASCGSLPRALIQKIYVALVQGVLKEERGRIELAIARDPNRRTRMTAKRAALLHKRASPHGLAGACPRRFHDATRSQLHTGRTHQIRVHFSALRHPVVETRSTAPQANCTSAAQRCILGRNFLHAAKIAFASRTGQLFTSRRRSA